MDKYGHRNLAYIIHAAIVIYCEAVRTYMYGKLGSQLILQCPLQSISTFTWRGPPILRIYSSNGQVVSSKKNIVFVNRTNMGTETLTIKNYNEATAGLYQCETIVNGQATEHEIQVMTAVSPEIWKIYDHSNKNYRKLPIWPSLASLTVVRKDEGSFMRLICSVVKCGRPNGVIYWIENDASVNKTCGPTVPPVETILETNVTESDHEKLYTCVADNGIMQQNKSVTLLVNLLPTVTIITDSPSVVPENSDVTFTCETTTNTNPVTVLWKFDNRIVTRGNKTKVLTIKNTMPDDFGRYTCEARNRIGSRSASVDLLIRHKPLTLTNENTYIHAFEAEINRPTIVTMKVRSYPRPECSWIKDQGGKLSTILVTHVNLNIFSIKASIVVETDQMFGDYSMRVRNDVGAIDLTFGIIARTIITSPRKAACNVSNTLTIYSTIHSYPDEVWTSIWNHQIQGQIIRSLTGETIKNVSKLEIKFCDYRDAGDYACQWTSTGNTLVSKSNVEVIVNGPPILTSRSILKAGTEMIRFEVRFHSRPEPRSILWLKNDKIIHTNASEIALIEKREISITFYDKQIQKQGYAAYRILSMTLVKNSNITCIVDNDFGIRDILFRQDYIRKRVAEISISEGRSFMTLHVYVIVFGIAVGGLVICIGLVVRKRKRICQCFLKKDHRISLPAAEEEGQQIRIYTTEQQVTDVHTEDYEGYEEIQSIQLSSSQSEEQRLQYTPGNVSDNDASMNTLSIPVYLDFEADKSHDDLNSSKSDPDSYTREYLDPKHGAYEDLGSEKSDSHVYFTNVETDNLVAYSNTESVNN